MLEHMYVCLSRKGKKRVRGWESTCVEDGQAPMDGGAFTRAKCNLTAEFNDIYFRATHFQTCSGFILSTGPELKAASRTWCEFTVNVCG